MDPDFQRRDSGESALKRAEELNTLRYWLANEDIYTSAYVRKWLERTPREAAVDTLAEMARTARPESHSLLRMMFHALTAMLTTAEIISDNSPAGRKAGIRAAMLLAGMNDPRALPPLARVLETHWFWEGKYQAAIEAALLRLLADVPETLDLSPYRTDLRKIVEDLLQFGHGKQEISSRRADLLIAALKRLAPIAEETDFSLLQKIASAQVRTPQRTRVKEAASALSA